MYHDGDFSFFFCLRCKEEPFGHGIAEEDELDQHDRVVRPAGHDEGEEQAGVLFPMSVWYETQHAPGTSTHLRDEVITDLPHEEKRKDAEAFTRLALAAGRIVPNHGHVSDLHANF